MTRFVHFILSLMLIASPGCHKQTRTTTVTETTEVTTSVPEPEVEIEALEIRLERTEIPAIWGMITEIPISVKWNSGQKYAVEIVPVGAPEAISVEAVPSIVDPPGRILLRITPALDMVSPGPQVVAIEAHAHGLREPVRKSVTIEVIHEDGEFIPVMAGPVTVECRNVCAKISGGRVAFYDVLREKEQTCSETAALPASQRIGERDYGLSATGFGFGRTCRVAAVFEPTGALALINIGADTKRVARGNVFVTIPNTEQCWLSPDNSLAIAKTGSNLRLYDIYAAMQIGSECTVKGTMPTPTIADNQISAGNCEWKVE